MVRVQKSQQTSSNRLHIACMDGALHMWQTKSNFVRPSMTIEGAHAKGSETGSVVFSVDGQTVLTRGGDDTVKRKPECIVLVVSLD